MSDASHDSPIPAAIGRGGRYRVVSVLGQGGMATVYRVTDSRLGVTRAVKVLAPEFAARPRLRQRFETEARAMAVLSHPNILAVYDVDEDEDSVYIVMELLPGGSVQDVVEARGPLHPAVAAEVMRQTLLGLQFAHEAGVVHRDIKPHNILLAHDGSAKLTDFGIAHVGMDGFQDAQTRTGAIMGTWAFMSPEQRLGMGLRDPRVDIYAATAALYAMVTARLPGDLHVSEAHETLLADVPVPLRAVLTKGTRYKPEERYATAAEMADALTAVIPSLGAPPEDPFGLAERRRAAGLPSQPTPAPLRTPTPPVSTPPKAVTTPPAAATMRGATFSAGDLDEADLAAALGGVQVTAVPPASAPPTLAPHTQVPQTSTQVPSPPTPNAPPSFTAAPQLGTPRTSTLGRNLGIVGAVVALGIVGVVLLTPTNAPAPTEAPVVATSSAMAPAAGQGVLNVTATGMAGAQVWIDGKRVGAVPVVQMIDVGSHEVRVAHAPSSFEETRTVDVIAGGTREVTFGAVAPAPTGSAARPSATPTSKPAPDPSAARPPAPPPEDRIVPRTPAPKAASDEPRTPTSRAEPVRSPIETPTAPRVAATVEVAKPSPAADGRVSAAGANLVLRSGGRVVRVMNGSDVNVPTGTWSVEARFESGATIQAKPFDVNAGGSVRIKCQEATQTCRIGT